jgi:hypothetical protein
VRRPLESRKHAVTQEHEERPPLRRGHEVDRPRGFVERGAVVLELGAPEPPPLMADLQAHCVILERCRRALRQIVARLRRRRRLLLRRWRDRRCTRSRWRRKGLALLRHARRLLGRPARHGGEPVHQDADGQQNRYELHAVQPIVS